MKTNPIASVYLLALCIAILASLGGCERQPALRVVYAPAEANQLLGAYEFWSPGPVEIEEALAAVDRAIAADARLKSGGTAKYGLGIVGRIDDGVRVVLIYGDKNWAKEGVPSPAVLRTGYSPTYLKAMYDTQKKAVTSLTAPFKNL